MTAPFTKEHSIGVCYHRRTSVAISHTATAARFRISNIRMFSLLEFIQDMNMFCETFFVPRKTICAIFYWFGREYISREIAVIAS